MKGEMDNEEKVEDEAFRVVRARSFCGLSWQRKREKDLPHYCIDAQGVSSAFIQNKGYLSAWQSLVPCLFWRRGGHTMLGNEQGT